MSCSNGLRCFALHGGSLQILPEVKLIVIVSDTSSAERDLELVKVLAQAAAFI